MLLVINLRNLFYKHKTIIVTEPMEMKSKTRHHNDFSLYCVYLTSTAISSSVVVDTATEVYDMVDDQYYEVVDVHGEDVAECTDTSRISTSDGYLIPVQTDRSSEHYADHTVQTDPDCIDNTGTDIDDIVINEKDNINGSENCDFAYITDAEIVYNGEPIVMN